MPLCGIAKAYRLRLIFSFAFSFAILWMILATCWQIIGWFRTPSPLPIVLAPVPRSRRGVVLRLALEILLFRSLARANLITWFAAMALHYGLLLVLLVHLRFLMPVLPLWFLPILKLSGVASLLLLSGLLVLLLRRVFVDRIRYISAPSDYLHLILLASIAISGVLMKRFWPTNLYEVGRFARGILKLDWQPLPDTAMLLVHLVLVLILLLIFPISKLLHGAAVFAAPTFLGREKPASGR